MRKTIVCAVVMVMLATPANAAFWKSICDAEDGDGMLQCYEKERKRLDEESEKSDKELMEYCQKKMPKECGRLERAIADRKKAEKAGRTYRESIDGMRQGMETLGNSLGNALRQGSEGVRDLFGGDRKDRQ